jgi:hypothetical protein
MRNGLIQLVEHELVWRLESFEQWEKMAVFVRWQGRE